MHRALSFSLSQIIDNKRSSAQTVIAASREKPHVPLYLDAGSTIESRDLLSTVYAEASSLKKSEISLFDVCLVSLLCL